MTENKRYTLRKHQKDKGVKIFDNVDEENWRVLNLHFKDYEDAQFVRDKLEPVVDLLNEQDKTIQQLSHDASVLIQANTDYRKENEQLKKELEDALLDVKIYKNANATFDNVYQENEKLKSRIEYLKRKIERERNATNKQYEKWEKEALEKINKLEKENEQLKEEIKDFQDLLARKEEELLKPVIRMIDDRINKVDTISAETLKELRNEIME